LIADSNKRKGIAGNKCLSCIRVENKNINIVTKAIEKTVCSNFTRFFHKIKSTNTVLEITSKEDNILGVNLPNSENVSEIFAGENIRYQRLKA